MIIRNSSIKILIKSYILLKLNVLILFFSIPCLQAQENEYAILRNKLLETTKDTSKINTYLTISEYFKTENIDSSLLYARKAYELSKSNKNYKFLETSKSISFAYSLAGNFEKSLEISILAYDYSKKINNNTYIALFLEEIGSSYLMLNDFEIALKYLNEALSKALDYRTRLSALVDIAQVYASTDRYTEAHKNYDEALSMAKNEKNSRDIAIIYNRIGNLYLMEEICDKSLVYYEKSINMLDTNDLYYIVAGLRGIVENFIVTKQYQKGLKIAGKADSLARKGGFIYETKLINLFISELYDSLGIYSKSLHYFRIFSALQDTIFNLEKYRRMNMMQTDFEAKQKELQLELLKKEARLNKRLNIIYLIICILIIVALFYFIKNIRQKNKILNIEKEKDALEKQKLELQLHEKQREILTHSMQIYQQKEVLSNIGSKLNIILEQQEPVKIKSSVKILNDEVKTSIGLSDDWEQIKLHFEKVHPLFFKTLKDEYPELSVNDLKLCAYTKLKFSNKEISRLLNINSSSVHIARYRLKKKLKMPEESNFDEFILNKLL